MADERDPTEAQTTASSSRPNCSQKALPASAPAQSSVNHGRAVRRSRRGSTPRMNSLSTKPRPASFSSTVLTP